MHYLNGYRKIYESQVDYDDFWDYKGRDQGTIYDTCDNAVLCYSSLNWGGTDGGGVNEFLIKDGNGTILANYPESILEWDCASVGADYEAGRLQDDMETGYVMNLDDGHTIKLIADARNMIYDVIYSLSIYLDDEYIYSFASFTH